MNSGGILEDESEMVSLNLFEEVLRRVKKEYQKIIKGGGEGKERLEKLLDILDEKISRAR